MNSYGDKFWFAGQDLHREDGPACEYASKYRDGTNVDWYVNNELLDPEEVINDSGMKLKYPKLIEAMIIHRVHNS
jgi:hypothetical protein